MDATSCASTRQGTQHMLGSTVSSRAKLQRAKCTAENLRRPSNIALGEQVGGVQTPSAGEIAQVVYQASLSG